MFYKKQCRVIGIVSFFFVFFCFSFASVNFISMDFRFPLFFHYVKSPVGIFPFPSFPRFFRHCLLQHFSIWHLLPRSRGGVRAWPLLRFVSYLNFVNTSIGKWGRGTQKQKEKERSRAREWDAKCLCRLQKRINAGENGKGKSLRFPTLMRLIYILSQLQQIKEMKLPRAWGDKIKIYIYFTAAALRCAMAIKSSPSKWHSTPFFVSFSISSTRKA